MSSYLAEALATKIIEYSFQFFTINKQARSECEKRWANCEHFSISLRNLYIIDYLPEKVCGKCQIQTSSKIFSKIFHLIKHFTFCPVDGREKDFFSDFPMGMYERMDGLRRGAGGWSLRTFTCVLEDGKRKLLKFH